MQRKREEKKRKYIGIDTTPYKGSQGIASDFKKANSPKHRLKEPRAPKGDMKGKLLGTWRGASGTWGTWGYLGLAAPGSRS
eukprot:207014-Pelagomonas_calceolata.AAC.1